MIYKAILVGEANPYGGDPAFALYPFPVNSAGGRLCRLVMDLHPDEYIHRFWRVNLCRVRWSIREARVTADRLSSEAGTTPIVLFGAKVCAAFSEPFEPFTVRDGPLVILPHPSGLSRGWNVPGAFERARATLRLAGVEV